MRPSSPTSSAEVTPDAEATAAATALRNARQEERRRQLRGSLWLAAAALLFALCRAILHDGLHHVFGIGWWRLW